MILSNVVLIRLTSFIIALLWILLLSTMLPIQMVTEGEPGLGFSWHAFLIATEDPMYPVNMQILMWIAFFYCVGELVIKWMGITEERLQLDLFNLYRNPSMAVLQGQDETIEIPLGPDLALKPEIIAAIYSGKRKTLPEACLMGRFFKTINFQFQSTNNVGDVYNAVNGLTEMELHRVDLRYTTIRYLVWLIPTLGFIGTVIGIALALGKAGIMGSDDPELLTEVVPLLATAFFTTLLALILSAILMLLIQQLQSRDEETVNAVGSECLDKIVTNLVPRGGQQS